MTLTPGTCLLSATALLFAFFGAFYVHLRPALSAAGVGRTIVAVGNTNCKTFPQLQACEKLVLHQPTGLVYLACSSPHNRMHWTPTLDRLNASGRTDLDYVAIYDPHTDAIHRLFFSGLLSDGISLHGMDVVPSLEDPSHLYVYLVNHRNPPSADARKVGADSVIEVFSTYIGSTILEHVRTFHDPAISTPNDVVGSPDGKSVYFTNDHKLKTGLGRLVSLLALSRDTSVGFCHADMGCRFAYTGLRANNGIVKGLGSGNDTFYVADCVLGDITVLERQSDNSLALMEVIKTDRSLDNLSIDANGVLWAAGLSDALGMVTRLINDPSVLVASSALRITINQGLDSFYGEKYKVDKVFEDPGELASGSTSAVYDAQRGRLFMHGLMSPHLTVCSL